ncbi:hypothetical protein Hbl1158_10390 [Halobaculum sp. CBA1158]|uniref:hypothetical protein n=1 Tax=Halobaculum sp. CBA1158 TaxID=2904243 RepID=UPI001F43927F|nr:hypothetical protein [Halobaculum sp. CBA1158]UIO98943.1 hypothetical protein Hbl1158_10390 [Halobaculum sp. CBA1158]
MCEEVSRSPRFQEVTGLAEASRRKCRRFDPDDDPAADAVAGVRPLVRVYVECRRDGVELSAVERSLLAGAINDWLRAYAAARDLPPFDGTAFSVHEVAMEYARVGDLRATLDRLLEA